MADYEKYEYLEIEVADGIALVEATNPGYTMRGHYELNSIWRELDRDHDVRSVIFTWSEAPKPPLGAHYPEAMGPEAAAEDPGKWWAAWQWPIREAREGIRDLLDSNKMIVSAMRGDLPYGAGLIFATLADVSIAAEDCVIADRHIDAAMVAGDGAVHWAMACGVQKAKYLALTAAEISGAEAERIGLVSLSVPDAEVMDKAWEVARGFAAGPQHAQNYTKRAFNQMHRLGGLVSYEVSNAYELLGVQADPDLVVAAEWGKAEQGEPRGYDVKDRPTLPSTKNPYGPDELRP